MNRQTVQTVISICSGTIQVFLTVNFSQVKQINRRNKQRYDDGIPISQKPSCKEGITNDKMTIKKYKSWKG
jgi:hypothetical protein